MGFFKKQVSPPEEEPKRDHSSSSEGSEIHTEAKVTVLACALGAVASIGGFIFGYVRYATPPFELIECSDIYNDQTI